MRRYWWVNHSQTSKHERLGGFLWSPKQNKNGAYNQFYRNMREAMPGDYVFSFADRKISFLGTVTDYAFTTPKPSEFGKTGASWAAEGWYLPISWRKLENPVEPRLFIDKLLPLLPKKYSPLKVSGDGNEVYLTAINFDIFRLVMSNAGIDVDLALAAPELASIFGDAAEQFDEAVERQISIAPELSATEIEQLIKARRGQGQFRINVQRLEKSCRLTGIESSYLLVASHIKPWRSCENSHERMDGNNGLMLTPHVDLLFDRGFISFSDRGEILISPRMSPGDLNRLGLNLTAFRPRQFTSGQCEYLEYHRQSVFILPADDSVPGIS